MSAVPLTNPEQHGDALTGKLERTELQEFRAPVGAQWTFLSDPGRTTYTTEPRATPYNVATTSDHPLVSFWTYKMPLSQGRGNGGTRGFG